MRPPHARLGLALLTLLAVAACAPAPPATQLLVSLVADGTERTFNYAAPVTVGEFLRDAGVQMGELDRLSHADYTQVSDGLRVTVVRVSESTECTEQELPFRQRTVLSESLRPGEERLGQPGTNGQERVCARVRVENGVRQPPVEVSRVVLISAQDEVVYVGPTGTLDPVAIRGSLAYISGGNAWAMRGSSTSKRLLTDTGDLDERVFALADDGQRLLFTRTAGTGTSDSFFNALWMIADVHISTPRPLQLTPSDVLTADWVPGQPFTISYSLGEATDTAPGWRAFNDLWLMRVDPVNGQALRVEPLINPSAGGLYGWWGTRYQWSPTGEQLAWVRADAMGLVDLTNGTLEPLLEYPVFETRQSWSWRATVSWAPNSDLIATTTHVAIGNYPPETSPAFSVAVVSADGAFDAEVVPNAGIWSAPKFSPMLQTGPDSLPRGYMAYLKARDPFNSVNGDYDLVVADRDGSNATIVFPEGGRGPGLRAQDVGWSLDGTQLAFIYEGNLWLLDVTSRGAHQLTLDASASHPVWGR